MIDDVDSFLMPVRFQSQVVCPLSLHIHSLATNTFQESAALHWRDLQVAVVYSLSSPS